MAPIALMCPRFSATRMMATGAIRLIAAHVEDGALEGRQAEPGGLADLREIDRLAEAQDVGADQVDQVADGTADQHRQAAPHARRVDRDEADRHAPWRARSSGRKSVPACVVGRDAGGAVDRDRREHEADGGDDGAGDHRRHQPLDPAVARDLHHEADEEVERAGRDDAAERQGDVRDWGCRPLAPVATSTGPMKAKLEPR